MKKNIAWTGFLIILLALDLFTKWLALHYLQNPLSLIQDFFQLSLSLNTGVAFSIPIPNAVMIILTPILIVIILRVISTTCNLQNDITKLSMMLIVAGGLGNLINRIISGAVIDMIAFSFWPSFNLADTYLTIGTFLLIIFYGKIAITYGRRK